MVDNKEKQVWYQNMNGDMTSEQNENKNYTLRFEEILLLAK